MRRASFVAVVIAVAAPALAYALPTTLNDFATWIVGYLNQGIGLLAVTAIALFFYGTTSRILSTHEGKTTEMRTYLVWGIGVIFIMFSIWGILSFMQATLFSGGYSGGSDYGGTAGGSNSSYGGVYGPYNNAYNP